MQTASNGTKQQESAPPPHVVGHVLAAAATSLVVGTAVAWILALAWITARADVTAPGPASADELLALAAATLALVIAAWLLVGTVLEVLAHVPGRIGRAAQVWAEHLTPALARRIAAFLLGVGVGVAGGPSQAVASPRPSATAVSVTDPGLVPTPSAPGPSAPDPGFSPAPVAPGFTPTAPRVRPQADPALLGGRVAPRADREVVVHRGDTLWSIAARHLGPQASDAEIAWAWPRWFDLNRALIGDDPDVILPGQILRVPGADQTASVRR